MKMLLFFSYLSTRLLRIDFFIVFFVDFQLIKTVTVFDGNIINQPNPNQNRSNFKSIQCLTGRPKGVSDPYITEKKIGGIEDSKFSKRKLEEGNEDSLGSSDDKKRSRNISSNLSVSDHNYAKKMPHLSVSDHNYANEMTDLSFMDHNYAKKKPKISYNDNESTCCDEEMINDLVIPIKDLQKFQIKIFLSQANIKIDRGIIRQETHDLLNRIPKDTIFYRKIYNALNIVEVKTVIENGTTVFLNDDICFGKIYPKTIDNLTDVPFQTLSKNNNEAKIQNNTQVRNNNDGGFQIKAENSEKVLGICFEPLKIFYEDILNLTDEVKKNSNIKKLFKNFMCTISMDDREYLKLVETTDNNFFGYPNTLLNQDKCNFIKLTEFSELNIRLEVDDSSKFKNQVIISQVLEKIRNIDLMNEELLKKFFIKLDNLKNPIYVRYIKNEIMKFDIKSKIGFDPNKNNVARSYLDKKYKYLMMYHKYLKIFIGKLDFKKIKEFFEEQNDLRKKARLEEISEYKKRLDKKRLEDLQMKFRSQKNVWCDERMDLNGLEKKDTPQKKEFYFDDIEFDIEYEKSESDCLRRYIVIKMLDIMHSVKYFVGYDFDKLYEENNSLVVTDFEKFNKLITHDLYKYKNSPFLGTSNDDHKEFILRLDYEATRISSLKDRLVVGIRKISALIDLSGNKKGDQFSSLKSKLEKWISYEKFIKTFLYRIVKLKRMFECFFIEYSVKLTGNIHLLSEEEIILIKGNFKCKEQIENDFITKFNIYLDTQPLFKSDSMIVVDI